MSLKRVHPVKVMLNDEEMAAAQRMTHGGRLPLAEVLREGWLVSMFRTLGLATMRAKKNRGSAEELRSTDFEPSAFDRFGIR